MKKLLKDILLNKVSPLLRYAGSKQMVVSYNSYAYQQIERYIPSYLPFTGSSITPRALKVLINEIIINKRRRIVEFGSGISTVVLSNVLREQGDGKLISFEHDPNWISIVKSWLNEDSPVTIHESSLVETEMDGGKCFWYDLEVICRVLEEGGVDMVLVDGPIAVKNPLARKPALDQVAPFLASKFSVFLDDAGRKGEEEIAGYWAERHNLKLMLPVVETNMAILRPMNDTSYVVL